jgi:hypothetical protein
VEFQELKSLPLITRPGGHELCVASDGPNGHARSPKVRADDDPVEIGRTVPTATGLVAVDLGDDQAGSLVVAERACTLTPVRRAASAMDTPSAGISLGGPHPAGGLTPSPL